VAVRFWLPRLMRQTLGGDACSCSRPDIRHRVAVQFGNESLLAPLPQRQPEA
jgi:hypothetical protein